MPEKKFPPAFLLRMKNILGNEFPEFIHSLNSPSPVSIRLNPSKQTSGYEKNEKVLWCASGRYLPSRPEFVFDPLFHAGAYYVQEASSMILSQAINFSSDLKILDLCAAPGGKSTLLASCLSENSLLVSNETINSRVKILEENMIRWGNPNVVVTNNDPRDFAQLENYFDVVVIDAPCSGEGMFRKDKIAIEQWSENNVLHCAERQKRILKDIIPALKPNGLLIYSTCTFSQEENENNVQWVMGNYPNEFELKKIIFPPEWKISNGYHADKNIRENTSRLYPHQVQGEGLFLVGVRKKSSQNFFEEQISTFRRENNISKSIKEILPLYIDNHTNFEIYTDRNKIYGLPQAIAGDVLFLKGKLRMKMFGIFIGEMKGDDFIPSHDLALSSIINKNIQRIELSKEEAIIFLKKEEIALKNNSLNGWVLVTFQHVPLGWIKIIGNRAKNYFPISWRIRK